MNTLENQCLLSNYQGTMDHVVQSTTGYLANWQILYKLKKKILIIIKKII